MAVWKTFLPTQNAPAIEARLVTTPTKATSGELNAIGRRRKPKLISTANTSGVRADSARSTRSWFSAAVRHE